MTNKDRQRSLDNKKWNESRSKGRDLSGFMDYCKFCDHHKEGFNCTVSQDDRESESLCAKSYNRMIRSNNK